MSMDVNDGQMLFGDRGGLKLPDICLTGEEKPHKTTQETCTDLGLNLGLLGDRHACNHLAHSGGPDNIKAMIDDKVKFAQKLLHFKLFAF